MSLKSKSIEDEAQSQKLSDKSHHIKVQKEEEEKDSIQHETSTISKAEVES